MENTYDVEKILIKLTELSTKFEQHSKQADSLSSEIKKLETKIGQLENFINKLSWGSHVSLWILGALGAAILFVFSDNVKTFFKQLLGFS